MYKNLIKNIIFLFTEGVDHYTSDVICCYVKATIKLITHACFFLRSKGVLYVDCLIFIFGGNLFLQQDWFSVALFFSLPYVDFAIFFIKCSLKMVTVGNNSLSHMWSCLMMPCLNIRFISILIYSNLKSQFQFLETMMTFNGLNTKTSLISKRNSQIMFFFFVFFESKHLFYM